MNEIIEYMIHKIGRNFIFIERPIPNSDKRYVQVYKRGLSGYEMNPFVRVYQQTYMIAGVTLHGEHFYEIRDNEDEILTAIHKEE